MNEDDKYEDFDDELLEDFEKELEIENKAHQKKRILIGVGALAGLALAFYLSGGETPAPVDTAANVQAPAAPNPAAPAAKASEPVSAAPAEPEVKPVETVRESEENLEEQIAALQEHNMINEDFQAPGALMDDTGEQETGAGEPEPEAIPSKPAPQEPAPQATETAAEPEKQETATAMAATPTAPAAAAKPEPKTAPQVESSPYSVEIHAGMDAVAALDLRDKLVDKGFDAWISIGKVKKTVFRVEAGRFKSIREASGLSAKMAESGFETRAAYVDNGKVATLIAGTFQDRSAAENLRARIRSAGFTPEVRQKSDSISLYHVRAGRFGSREEASSAMQSVKAAGFPARGIIR